MSLIIDDDFFSLYTITEGVQFDFPFLYNPFQIVNLLLSVSLYCTKLLT